MTFSKQSAPSPLFAIACATTLVLGLASANFVHAQGQQPLVVENAILKIVEQRSVPAQSPGVLRMNEVREGDLVSAGQMLMQIDDARAGMELEKSKLQLQMAREEAASRVDIEHADKTIKVAETELKRAHLSNQRTSGAVSQSEIDKLDLLVEQSRAEKLKLEFAAKLKEQIVSIRDLEFRMNAKSVSDHQIKSPIDGMVVEVFRREGEWVDASAPVLRIVRLDKLKVELKMPAEQAISGLVGREAVFIPSLASLHGKRFTGRVTFVHPEANPVNSQVRVWVEIENPNLELIAGLTGRVEVMPPSSDEAHAIDSTP